MVVAGPLSCCPPSVGRRRGLEGVSPFGKFLTSGEVRNEFGRGRWEGEGSVRGEERRVSRRNGWGFPLTCINTTCNSIY